ILKKIAEPLLPREIVYRKKMGFIVPTKDWLKGGLSLKIQEIISELKDSICLNDAVLDNIALKHESGAEDHSKLLLTAFVFAEWQKNYL
ncbi:MAG: asparagine synthetase B, partial [Deltaproteobacteria bacterium]|nr:asparagine synthetase B [Deltaproteobacteria bacterium]